MSLFGNPSNTFGTSTNQPSGGLFGNQSNTTQNQPNQSTFSNPNPLQPQPTLPSLFTTPATNTGTGTGTNTGGGLFGSTNTNPSGGLFGGGQTSGLFGNTQQQQQQPASGGLFGNNPQQQQQQQPQQPQQQPAAGGLFGNTQQQPAQSGGIFGSATQQQQPTGTGLFGINTQQQQQQPVAGGSLFGSTNQQSNTGGGLFGNTTQQQQQPNQPAGGSLFGSTTQNAGGGLFGTKPGGVSNSLFAQQPQQQQPQPQQQQGGGIFGSSIQQQKPGSLFGSTLGNSTLGGGLGQQGGPLSASLLSSRPSVAPAQQQGDPQVQFMKLVQSIENTYNAWDPSSPHCRFQHNFYNLVDPNQVNLYGRPPNAKNDVVWEKAMRENPDPSCFVPVVAIGFDDLRERVEAQTKQAQAHQEKLKEIKSRLESLNTQHSVSNSSRLLRASAQQTQITQRLLAFVQHLHLLIPAIRSSSITPEEEQLRGKLEEIEDEVKRGRMKSKLNELWALLGAVNAGKERLKSGSTGEWAVVDEEGVMQIAQILSEQQAGLAHLTKILQKNLKDLNVIVGGGSRLSNETSHLQENESLRSSMASTLRSSSLR